MHTTERLPAPGQAVTVTDPEGYSTTGRLIGQVTEHGVQKVRVLGRDRIERRIPLPATVTAK